MSWCLIPKLSNQFLKELRAGEISPEKLNNLSSQDRHKFFADKFGEENAKNINALFESKLLLKNKERGMITWAKKVAGLTADARRDMIARIQRMDKILSETDEKAFLQDLASKRLGIDITIDEAKKITDLSQKIQKLSEDVSTKDKRIAYGNAIVDMQEYLDSIAKKPMSLFGNIVNVANVPRALMSTLDFSAPLRQGWGMLSRPKQFIPAFVDMFKYAFSEKAYRNLTADIITRPNYDLMKAGGLRITGLTNKLTMREEEFMTTLLDRIPGVRGSERAYSGFLTRLRADVFDTLIQQAKMQGEDVSKGSQNIKDIASVVNNFTGSGNLGKNDRFAAAVPMLNSLFFSPRKIAATVNMFNPTVYAGLSPVARRAAMRNLIGSIGVTSVVLFLASLMGADWEKDPVSSDFGKVKVGDTRLDVTGGNGNYVVLLARLLTGKTKSTTTELTRELGSGFGSTTRGDLLVKYIRNKLSPTASFIGDWLYGTDAIGTPFSVKEEVKNRIMPMTISGFIDSANNDPDNAIMATLLGLFGVGVQTYSINVDWSKSTSKELNQLKDKIGEEKFTEANQKYNQLYKTRFENLKETKEYQNLSEEQKQKVITDLKSNIKDIIFKNYRFKYKQEKKSASDKAADARLKLLSK